VHPQATPAALNTGPGSRQFQLAGVAARGDSTDAQAADRSMENSRLMCRGRWSGL